MQSYDGPLLTALRETVRLWGLNVQVGLSASDYRMPRQAERTAMLFRAAQFQAARHRHLRWRGLKLRLHGLQAENGKPLLAQAGNRTHVESVASLGRCIGQRERKRQSFKKCPEAAPASDMRESDPATPSRLFRTGGKAAGGAHREPWRVTGMVPRRAEIR
jgi:hypothetical protein